MCNRIWAVYRGCRSIYHTRVSKEGGKFLANNFSGGLLLLKRLWGVTIELNFLKLGVQMILFLLQPYYVQPFPSLYGSFQLSD
jgi:hypothetical protein